MAYTIVSVAKQNSNQGRPISKKNIIILFKFDDVVTFTKAEDNITVSAIKLKDTINPIGLFVDESTIDGKDTIEGDDYARGYIQSLAFVHPGYELDIRALKDAYANENLGAIVIPCDPSKTDADIFGTPCSPLKMSKADSTSNKESNKNEFELKSSLRGAPIGIIAKTSVPVTDNAEINTYLGLSAAGA